MRRYLAYGSNLSVPQMEDRCPAARPEETVLLSGWRFIINSRGVATIVPDSAARVQGLIWRLTPGCEAALDAYEGVARGYYHRAELGAGCASALAYLAADTSPGVPRPGYLEGILGAAKALGFEPEYRAELATWTRRAA